MSDASANGASPPAEETTLYLVRHGQTEYNRQHRVQGRRIDSALNATGRRQAQALSERFADVAVDAFYVSTLRRTRQTAEIIARRHPSASVHYLEDLEEMSWGAYEGRPTTGEVSEAFDATKARWRAGDFGAAVEGGESARQVQRRGLRAVRKILDEQAGQAVMIVTHGRFLRVLIASLLKGYGLEKMHAVEHSNTCVNHLVGGAGGFEARLLNCTAHLDDAEAVMAG